MSKYSVIDNLLNKAAEKLVPIQASLEVTSKCNHRCLHCYLEKKTDDDLLFNDWKIILDKLRDAGTLYVILMGGEALLHNDFFKILNHARNLSFHVSLITNGNLIDSLDYAERLKEAGLSQVTISLYSMNASIHDKLTQVNGSHVKAMKALRYVREVGLEVGINSLLTKYNIDDYFELAEYAYQNKMFFNSDPVVTCDLLGKRHNLTLRPSREQLEEHVAKKIEKWPESIPRPFDINPEGHICNIARSKCAVNHKGELMPCIEVREAMGNLVEEDFDRLWHSSIANKWRELKNKQIKNKFNDETDLYVVNCPGMGLNELGDPLVTPDYMKSLAEVEVLVKDKYVKDCRLPFSGESMLPLLKDSDELIADFEVKNYNVGDILLFRQYGELTAHRVVIGEDGLVMKGDRSLYIDHIDLSDAIGVVTGFKRKKREFYWGIKGQMFNKIIAILSSHATSDSPRAIRRFFFVLIYFFTELSFLFMRTKKID